MRVRIIAGEFGGRFIQTPPGSTTHPMGERVRSAMFNSLGETVRGARVLDAFAGSGAIGLEALSRGAESVVFVERDRVAQRVIAKNITSLGADEKSIVIKTTISNWMETADVTGEFDIIFADPPYHNPQFSTVSRLMGLLKPGGTMILSHPGIGEVPIQDKTVVVDSRSYGEAHLTKFLRLE
ncbi:methyltransferase [Candidatus Nanosynbacter lyticus]|uniref:Methyltransferase n=1 Tax=Candidatus Nanosynbacter lyticus TaxID=2093824 RepID=A0A6S4GR40_9BACT|nr:16S rRNA (guanine(966)-N(2))-methyltransferase RsmD [Candidatus Nanosynbacter lyticus]AJA06508.1 methyltransferase [Candidatus Nanosynbacter lyticus]QCT41582.1 16S rRNA (guanine(966)-N(2))-methyltransferase RsmD [TM7 phylum sp. oral taxon 952]